MPRSLGPTSPLLLLALFVGDPAVAANDSTKPTAAEPPAAARPLALESADGVAVSADLYEAAGAKAAPIVLLFHQAGSNAAEYATIAPRLVRLGFSGLAIDLRAGGRLWGRNNRTVLQLGRSSEFHAAYADMEAALEWARAQGYPRILAWGSSYTAALVFRLAAEHSDVAAVLSFSPGEYLGPGEPVRERAAQVRVPIFVTSATGHEVDTARWILAASPAETKIQHVPTIGVHGSSTLREDRNPGGTDENWAAVEVFLSSFVN